MLSLSGSVYRNIVAAFLLLHTGSIFSQTKAKTSTDTNPEKFFVIGHIDGEASEKISLVTIRLNGKIQGEKPVITAHKSFLQFNLQNTMTPKPGDFIDLKGPLLKKLIAIQTDEKNTVIRIFTKINAEEIIKASEIDFLNKRIVFSVSHQALSDFKGLAVKTEKKVSDKKDSTPPPAELEKDRRSVKKAGKQNTPWNSPAPVRLESNRHYGYSENRVFNQYIVKMAWISFTLIVFLLAALSIRRVFRNKKILGTSAAAVPMQTLNDLVLAPRQKLSIVQVGKERLLLSVSPDGISLLSHMDDLRKNDSGKSSAIRPEAALTSRGSFSALLKSPLPATQGRTRTGSNAQSLDSGRRKEASRTNGKATGTARKILVEKKRRQGAGKSVGYAITDDGVSELSIKHAEERSDETSSAEKAIEDVTQLIREKLKSLPKL